jgi:hypothetical protein
MINGPVWAYYYGKVCIETHMLADGLYQSRKVKRCAVLPAIPTPLLIWGFAYFFQAGSCQFLERWV